MFSKIDVVGWYSTGSEVQEVDLQIHKKVGRGRGSKVMEATLFASATPALQCRKQEHCLNDRRRAGHIESLVATVGGRVSRWNRYSTPCREGKQGSFGSAASSIVENITGQGHDAGGRNVRKMCPSG